MPGKRQNRDQNVPIAGWQVNSAVAKGTAISWMPSGRPDSAVPDGDGNGRQYARRPRPLKGRVAGVGAVGVSRMPHCCASCSISLMNRRRFSSARELGDAVHRQPVGRIARSLGWQSSAWQRYIGCGTPPPLPTLSAAGRRRRSQCCRHRQFLNLGAGLGQLLGGVPMVAGFGIGAFIEIGAPQPDARRGRASDGRQIALTGWCDDTGPLASGPAITGNSRAASSTKRASQPTMSRFQLTRTTPQRLPRLKWA